MGKDDIVFLPSKEVVINTIKKFQTDSSLQWIFFAYQESDPSTKLAKGNSNTIELARSGNEPLDRNQLENLRDVTKDEESIKAYLSPHSANYFIARIDANRYIFINWIGTKTKTLQKTRVMTHRLELKSMAEKLLSMSFVFDHNGIDEFDKLVNIVDSSRSFEFENMKDQKQSVSSPRQSSQVASASASLKSASSSASTTTTTSTTTSSSQSNSSSSTNVGNNSATKGSLMNRYNPQTLTEQEQINARRHQRSGSKPPKLGLAAIMRQVLKLDESNITPLLKQRSFGWLLLGYNGDGLCQVEGQGNDQCTFPDPLFDALKEDDMQYIVLRWVLSNTGYGGDVEKTYFLSYVGSAVNSVRRGKVNQHKQEVYDYVNKHFQLGGEVTITALEELNVDYIKNVMLGNRSANTVTLTDWGTVPVKASPVTAATTTQAKPISSPLSSPRNTKKETTTTTATVATSSVTTEHAPEKPIERKGSELLSKIKLGFKDGRLKGIKGTTPEPAEDLTSPKNMKSPGRSETLKSPGRDGLTSPGRRKSTKGGILSFSANNMDKFSTSLKKKDIVKVTALGTGQNAIKVDDETKVIDKLYELKDPLDRNNQWVLFSYPNDKTLNVLSLVDSGSEPIASSVAVTSHLTDSSVKFFIHKFYVERNSRIEAKFRVIIWRGKSIRAYFKAICTNHAMKLATTIAPVITQVEGDPIILADVADVPKVVLPLEGFGTPLDHNDAIKKLEEKLAAAEQREKQKDSSSPSNNKIHERRVSMKKADYNAGIEAGLKILNEEDLIKKMKDLQSDDTDVSWITISYKDSKTLQLDGSGSGTAESFKSKLTDDKVYYILYKQFLDELGGAPKTILIAWVGQDVKPMAKASTTPHRIALFKYCLRHVTLSSEYQPIGINDLDNDSIFGKVSGGSKSGSSGVLSKSFGGKSQSLTLVEDSVILENVKDLNSDATATNWVKLGYNENGHLRYEEKGQGGLAEFERRLSDDSVNYVLYKTYVEHSPKITLITWVGSGVTAGTAKARATTHQLELEGFVKKVFTVAALYQALEREELKEELIYKKVAGSNIIVAPTAVSKGTFGGRDSSLKFESDQAVLDAFKELRGNSGIRWLLFEYVPGNQYTVRVAQIGKGGVRNFKQYLTDNVVAYVVMRLTFMEYSDVAKAIVITWVGENAQSFQKALSGGHRINLYEYTKKQISVGGEYQPESLDSLSDEDLLSKITGTKSDNAGDALEEKIQQQRTFERERIVQVQPTIEVKDSKQYIGEFKDIEFGGKEEIKKALLDLSEKCRKEQHDRALEDATIHYVKMKLTGKELRDVVIETTGDGALTEEWRAANLNSNECLLFIFGLFTSEGGYGMMTKYVFVQWIGHDTKHLLKAKASEIRQSIYNFCNKELNMSGEIQGCTKPEHITKKLVLEKITGSNVRGSEMQLAKKDKKFEGLGKEKKSKLVIKDQEKLNHYVEDMILQDYLEKDDKKDDDDPEEWRNHKRITQGKLDWILMSYDKDSIDEIHVSAYGEGDVESFKQHLKPDSVNFVIIRVFHAQGYAKDISMLTDNRINLAKPYFTLIYWKGENVQIIEKALTSHHFNAFHKLMTQKFMRMKSSLQGSTYQAEKYEELEMERIKKLMRLYD